MNLNYKNILHILHFLEYHIYIYIVHFLSFYVFEPWTHRTNPNNLNNIKPNMDIMDCTNIQYVFHKYMYIYLFKYIVYRYMYNVKRDLSDLQWKMSNMSNMKHMKSNPSMSINPNISNTVQVTNYLWVPITHDSQAWAKKTDPAASDTQQPCKMDCHGDWPMHTCTACDPWWRNQ